MSSFHAANLKLKSTSPIKGIYYIGQYGTSGYAQAAKGYLFKYFAARIPVRWEPLYFDDSTLTDNESYNIIIKSLINKKIDDYEMVIMHSTPDLWPKFWETRRDLFKNKVVNGYCTWETNILPQTWVDSINTSVNSVWCPSYYNKASFQESGVTVPIHVVPHIFLPQALPPKQLISITDSTTNENLEADGRFSFYTIGELNERKGIVDLIHTFCKTFDGNKNVRLIIKTHYKDYTEESKNKCKNIIYKILEKYPKHPPVICFFDCLASEEILALHAIGDCYISLTKSEGFGLTIFDAFNYNKQIITTGYSGHIDFLGLDYKGLVKYKIGKVENMASFSSIYTSEQEWAIPDLEHAGELMKKVSNI